MAIDVSKLENCRSRGRRLIARCPACAEMGHDRKGNHLFINEEGRFGCVVYPGSDGHVHRKRIFELAGDKAIIKKTIDVKIASQTSQTRKVVVDKDILGQLGHHFQTRFRNH